MQRTISILNQPTMMSDRDGSHYLATMPERFEPDVLSMFGAICGPRSKAIDVGANIGMTAIALGRICRFGKVLAAEASPETYQYLIRNVAEAKLANVSCVNMAAASAPGQVDISVHPLNSSGAFIANKYRLKLAGSTHHTVPARPIDELVETTGFGRVDFMKIDVEGFELEVLRGARQTIQRCKPAIFCEVNHWCLNVLQRMSLPDFVDGVREIVPHLFAVHADGSYLDLSDTEALHIFYHQHVVTLAYMNLLCGFDKPRLIKQLDASVASGHGQRTFAGRLSRSWQRVRRTLLKSA